MANKIALGQIEVGIAGGTDTTSDAPVAIGDKLRKKLVKVNSARDMKGRLTALAQIRPGDIGLDIPQNGEPRTRMSMGEHAALTALEWRIGREEQDELAVASHQHLAAAYDAGFLDDQVTPFRGLERDQNLRPDSSVEKLSTLKPVFGKGEAATMTAGNSTPLTDGASTVLLSSEDWAKERELPVLAYLTASETAAVDYVHGGEGLLMAPAYAVSRMLERAGALAPGLRLLRDPRGVRLAGAQPRSRPGRTRSSARSAWAATTHSARSTAHGSTSTARRWRPAIRSPRQAAGSSTSPPSCSPRRAPAGRSISICAAGGQGVVAILER